MKTIVKFMVLLAAVCIVAPCFALPKLPGAYIFCREMVDIEGRMPDDNICVKNDSGEEIGKASLYAYFEPMKSWAFLASVENIAPGRSKTIDCNADDEVLQHYTALALSVDGMDIEASSEYHTDDALIRVWSQKPLCGTSDAQVCNAAMLYGDGAVYRVVAVNKSAQTLNLCLYGQNTQTHEWSSLCDIYDLLPDEKRNVEIASDTPSQCSSQLSAYDTFAVYDTSALPLNCSAEEEGDDLWITFASNKKTKANNTKAKRKPAKSKSTKSKKEIDTQSMEQEKEIKLEEESIKLGYWRLCYFVAKGEYLESDDDVFDMLCGLMSGQGGDGNDEIIEQYRATKTDIDNGYQQYRSTMSKPQYMSKWVSDKKTEMEVAKARVEADKEAIRIAYINALSANKEKRDDIIINYICEPLENLPSYADFLCSAAKKYGNMSDEAEKQIKDALTGLAANLAALKRFTVTGVNINNLSDYKNVLYYVGKNCQQFCQTIMPISNDMRYFNSKVTQSDKDKVVLYSSIISSCWDPMNKTSAAYYIMWLSGDWLY